MANSKNYKALLIREDARALVDEARKMCNDEMGVDLNYSQFITLLCKKFMSDMKLMNKGE